MTASIDFVRSSDEETLATQIGLSEIPAPPFEESERGAQMVELLRSAGLDRVDIDDAGNVVAERFGSSTAGALVVSAHLDTVFPAGTDVSVTRDGPLLRGPGISDDARGLATLVALARSMREAGLRTRAPLLFVATVGEEGPGDLRGAKALFSANGRARDARAFISLDGAGLDRIVARGLGSRRYRITMSGPGGHSWTDWGTANPAHALMALGAKLSTMELEREPKTTLTIARTGGGTSINAIPQSAWLEVDTRSADEGVLERIEARVREAAAAETSRHPELEHRVEVIGQRPGGSTDPKAPLVRAAIAATRALEREPKIALSSTDANVPMTMGIPAITLGCGGEAGNAHTTEEWYRNTRGPEGILRALYTVLLSAGVDGA